MTTPKQRSTPCNQASALLGSLVDSCGEELRQRGKENRVSGEGRSGGPDDSQQGKGPEWKRPCLTLPAFHGGRAFGASREGRQASKPAGRCVCEHVCVRTYVWKTV